MKYLIVGMIFVMIVVIVIVVMNIRQRKNDRLTVRVGNSPDYFLPVANGTLGSSGSPVVRIFEGSTNIDISKKLCQSLGGAKCVGVTQYNDGNCELFLRGNGKIPTFYQDSHGKTYMVSSPDMSPVQKDPEYIPPNRNDKGPGFSMEIRNTYPGIEKDLAISYCRFLGESKCKSIWVEDKPIGGYTKAYVNTRY
jgi:hypothetical protein